MRSLRQKLLLLILPLCLIPLTVISFVSYFQAKGRITEDRIALYLEQIAQGLADTIRLTLLEKQEETLSMGLAFREYMKGEAEEPQTMLNQLLLIHEVYDVIVVFDIDGRIKLINSINRSSFDAAEPLDPRKLESLKGQNVTDFTPDSEWFQQVRSSRFGFIGWHRSQLVRELYQYESEDIAQQFNIGFATPISDDRGVVIGGILSLMSWYFIQELLDHLEDELAGRSLRSGYAFLFSNDGDTIIAHKYRTNRLHRRLDSPELGLQNNYGTSLIQDHQLGVLVDAVQELRSNATPKQATNVSYEYPEGTPKISGLAVVDHPFFDWVCGVGINSSEIFAPVQQLKNVLVVVSVLSALLVVILTFYAARQITTPLKQLTAGATIIAAGDLSQRVQVSVTDEIGALAKAFNGMAESLQQRSRDLLELNRSLEKKVLERTSELEVSNRDAQRAYQELKETQVQLVQSEKMASLGQLVAGIAHEIKNPLNFIYGNTDFLKQYIATLQGVLDIYESSPDLSQQTRERAQKFKAENNFDFMLEDLGTLVANFEEGAGRIHSIIGDLRAFSRLDSDEFRPVDLHETIELALNLLAHEYRNRIEIHREFSDIPKISCHAGKLNQVFMNLLGNACQAVSGEGDIWVRTRLENEFVVVEVQDSGEGIPLENQSKIFEPFFTTKSVGQGTGLGLSISYGIIQQHGGTISVESKPGEGALFQIRLPVSES